MEAPLYIIQGQCN